MLTRDTWTGCTPFGNAEGVGVAKGAGGAKEVGVATGVKETGNC